MDYQYDYYQPQQQPEPPRRRGGTSVALVLVIALLAGILGGGLAFYVLQSRNSPLARPGGDVVIQTVAMPDGASSATVSYASTIEEVVAIAASSVVEVSTESKVTHPFWGSFITGGAGSGVVLSADGYLITNQHVIDNTNVVSVRLSDGRTFPATIVGADAQTDLAVLKIDAEDLTPIVFADSATVNVGQLAVAIGNPLGTLGGSATEGIISAKDREIQIDGQAMTLLQTSAAINPGNSGGGLFDRFGHLVGIVSAKSSGTDIEGLGFAIPADTVQHVVTELIEHGYVTGRPTLGVSAAAITRRSDLYQYRLSEAGVYVTSVHGAQGLERWDLIRAVDGTAISSVADIKAVVDRHAVGDTVEVSIRRGSREMTVSVTLLEQQGVQTSWEII